MTLPATTLVVACERIRVLEQIFFTAAQSEAQVILA
jgi:hypothetical protein